MNRAEFRKLKQQKRIDYKMISNEDYENLIKTEVRLNLLEGNLKAQKDKIMHMTFLLYRAESFIDFILDQIKVIPTEEQLNELNQCAVERVNQDFPDMYLALDEPKEKHPQINEAATHINEEFNENGLRAEREDVVLNPHIEDNTI